jgi:hypothetical protein
MRQTPECAFERIADPEDLAAIQEVVAAGRAQNVAPGEVAVGVGRGGLPSRRSRALQ